MMQHGPNPMATAVALPRWARGRPVVWPGRAASVVRVPARRGRDSPAPPAAQLLYLVDTLSTIGGSHLTALGALAAAAGACLLLAPAGEAAADLLAGGHKPLMLTCHCVATIAVVAFALIADIHSPSEGGERDVDGWQLIALVVAVGVHRMATVAASSGTTLVQASAWGDPADRPARQAVLLSMAYCWKMVGAVAAVAALVLLPSRERVLPFLSATAFVRLLTVVASAACLHRPPPAPTPPTPPPGAPPPPTVWSKVRTALSAGLVRTPQGLRPIYVTCVLFGMAYGALAFIRTPYFASVIFQGKPGTRYCLRWSGVNFCLAMVVAIVIDAAIPNVAARLSGRSSRIMWATTLLLGGGLFVGLAVATSPIAAVALFTAQAVPISAHTYLSFVISVALAPDQISVTRSMILGATQVGFIGGALGAGALADRRDEGFRDVMAAAAVCTVLAAVAAMAVGGVPPVEKVTNVSTNGNALGAHLAARVRAALGRRPSPPPPAGGGADGADGGAEAPTAATTADADATTDGDGDGGGGGGAARGAPPPPSPWASPSPRRARGGGHVTWAVNTPGSDWVDDSPPVLRHRPWRPPSPSPWRAPFPAAPAPPRATAGGDDNRGGPGARAAGGDGGNGGGGGGDGSGGGRARPWPTIALELPPTSAASPLRSRARSAAPPPPPTAAWGAARTPLTPAAVAARGPSPPTRAGAGAGAGGAAAGGRTPLTPGGWWASPRRTPHAAARSPERRALDRFSAGNRSGRMAAAMNAFRQGRL
ncbi:hypothetical protein BU14_0331s0012 [Porphyra umbilicalis]|uniref:Uncharacterized protein n=1 Tax=Porphyra umbilicalis TaxID=2786 RepID=A0A1X6NYJ9_PORUM|nr:hypothetical protein BU14_0331s0012 [Porphyra umbilicalis]|eukprot:OSX73694.1 hypothetical protein BU14_0331s0012 [Porphyra umbilicalis]